MDRVGFEPTTSAEIIVVFTLIGSITRTTEEILWQGIYEYSPDQNSLPLYSAIWIALAYRTSVYHAKSICWRSRLLYLLCFIAWNIVGICRLENLINTAGVLAHGVHDLLWN
jgi:hypothetical protein